MVKKSVASERIWQNAQSNVSVLNKPYWNPWTLYHWEVMYNRIISSYNFSNKRIFVGGCGSGLFEYWLIRNSKIKPMYIKSMDVSDVQIKFAKMRCKNIKKITFYRGNMEQTKFKNKEFDVCVIIDALHHAPDTQKTLIEMKRIGNAIILSEPNALNPVRRLNELKYRNEGVKEISFYEWRLKKALRIAGYKGIKIYHQHFLPSFLPYKTLSFFRRIEPFIALIIGKISGSFLVISK